jgi:hypothetical protein
VVAYWLNDQGGMFWLVLLPFALIVVVVFGLTLLAFGYTVGTLISRRRSLVRRHARPFAVYLVSAVMVWGIFQGAPLVSRITDQSMIANFHRHRAEFEQLAEMAQEDRQFVRIAPDFTSPALWTMRSGTPVPPLPSERWDEYRALFRTTDLRDGVTNRDTRIEFDYWAYGFLDGAAYQGYAYSPEPLAPVVESIENARRTSKRGTTVYRPIGDGWYLYFSE